MRASSIPAPTLLALLSLLLSPACATHEEERESKAQHQEHEKRHKIIVTSPVAKDVVRTQQYVSQVHSRRHIEVRALVTGYLEEIHVSEGQAVKKGDPMFKIMPVLYQANLDKDTAEVDLAQIKYDNTQLLSSKSIVSSQELALAKAELARAQAQIKRARAELNFTALKAPFDGIVDRQHEQQGSLVEEGDVLSTLSDNEVMWVYFNVPEARYLQYKAGLDDAQAGLDIELQLANGDIFPHRGKLGAIEADFNNETGNIAFRADFPNPTNLLRHGQTGTILIHQTVPNAIVIPQRATYEILAKKYVYVVEPDKPGNGSEGDPDEDKGEDKGEDKAKPLHTRSTTSSTTMAQGIIRQREVTILDELDDIYLIKAGLSVDDKFVFEGVRDVRDGDKVEYELRPSETILSNLKYHAE